MPIVATAKEALPASVTVRMTDAEKAALAARAASLGLSMSALARMWIKERLSS